MTVPQLGKMMNLRLISQSKMQPPERDPAASCDLTQKVERVHVHWRVFASVRVPHLSV